MKHKKKKIIFLVPYPLDEVASQRFRFEQYIQILQSNGYELIFFPFFNSWAWRAQSSGVIAKKAVAFIVRLLNRVGTIIRALQAHKIFIHREVVPLGPPVAEWILSKVFGKKLIYDFDDAIWTTDNANENTVARWLRWRKKVASICAWSETVSCGNEYLATFAFEHGGRALVMPTTIDAERHHNPRLHHVNKNTDRLVIAWTGSHSTLKYLAPLRNVLKNVQDRFPNVDIMVIADRPADVDLDRLIFRPWSKQNEIEDLMRADVGIMPLPEDEWTLGKCGFKALQYMALEIPTVASPVGVNTKIIRHGHNGMLCHSDDDWFEAFALLLSNPDLRKKMGTAGRETVLKHYSVSANTPTFLKLFDDA